MQKYTESDNQSEILVKLGDGNLVLSNPDDDLTHHSLEDLVNSPPYDPQLTTVHDTNFWYPFYDFYKLAPYWV